MSPTRKSVLPVPATWKVTPLMVGGIDWYFSSFMCSLQAVKSNAEAARAIATDYDGDLSDCRSYVLRRLEAVPDAPLFHSGGASDWSISLSRGGRGVNVEVVGHVRPLPLLGVALAAFSESDGKGIVLRESLREEVLPSWIRGTYGDWQRLWA